MIKRILRRLFRSELKRVKHSPSLTMIRKAYGYNCNHCIYKKDKCYNLDKCKLGIKLYLEEVE